MTSDKITPELLDEVAYELEIRAEYPDHGEMIVPMHLMRRIQEALIWGADEVVQLREDFQGAQGGLVSLTIDYEALAGDADRLAEIIAMRDRAFA